MLLFFRIGGFSFQAVWGDRCTWPQYWAVTALLIGCTFVLTWVTDRLYQRAWAGWGAITAKNNPSAAHS
jgi:hypothetical protein